MSEKFEEIRVKRIVKKYGGDFSNLMTNASDKEMHLVLLYVARKANEKQQQIANGALAAA